MYSARVQLAAEMERLRQGAMRGQVPPAAEFVAPALMVVCALIAVIERDDVFRIWRRTAEGGAVKLPSSTLDPAMEAYVRSVKGCAPGWPPVDTGAPRPGVTRRTPECRTSVRCGVPACLYAARARRQCVHAFVPQQAAVKYGLLCATRPDA